MTEPYDEGTIRKVERFIERLHEMEITISSDAEKIFVEPSMNLSLYRSKEKSTLAKELGEAINQFEIQRTREKYQWYKVAAVTLTWITQAFTHNVVKDGQSLLPRLRERDVKISELQHRVNELEQSNASLVTQFDETRDKLIETQGELKDCNDKYDKLRNSWKGRGDISR